MDIYYNEDVKRDLFYKKVLQLVDPDIKLEDILINHSDGIINGNILEFKNNISNLNEVLFQTIKYLSRMRVDGQSIPSNIILISLDQEVAYRYNSQDYLEHIEKLYFTSASVGNIGFIGGSPDEVLRYGEIDIDLYKLRDALRECNYTKINIDENNVVGWSLRYYEELPSASKVGFLGETSGSVKIEGEIRSPEHFKEYILPYKESSNIKFDLICDKLNDNFQKKDLGAFYTPLIYAKKSHELVYEAIRRHQSSGNKDYVILDFCAGSGNLQIGLNEDVPEDIEDKDILSHCVLSTYEYIEWHILRKRLAHKVRAIIPAIEQPDTFVNGLVRGNDSLSEEFLDNELVKSYIEDKDTTIIVFENPPYAEASGIENQKEGRGKKAGAWKRNKAVSDAKSELKGAQSNDMANIFIWRSFNYYLRKPEDSLIVFAPLKYWKSSKWFNKEFIAGFAFNRRHFHTKADTVVSCILWSNVDKELETIELKAFDIQKPNTSSSNGYIQECGDIEVKRIHSNYSEEYYDKRVFSDDIIFNKSESKSKDKKAIWFSINGEERVSGSGVRVNSVYNSNIVGYLTAQSNTFELPSTKTTLIRGTQYNGNGFHLRADNFHEKLPMFAAGWYMNYTKDWVQDGVIYRCGDGAERYHKDLREGVIDEWLSRVLFYTALEFHNKTRSLDGTDGRFYVNELSLDKVRCLNKSDNVLSYRDTLLSQKLKELNFEANTEELKLLDSWNKILKEAKLTDNYNERFTYNPFQIEKELNTYKRVKTGRSTKLVYDYPLLNGHLKSLRASIKEYYIEFIVNDLFKYEFIK